MATKLVMEERDKTQAEPIKTCNQCFCWLPVKDGYKCIVSGKKRMGSMFACEFIENRRRLALEMLSTWGR